MNELLQIFVPALVALICTCWIYPYILKVAKTKHIVDNPNSRKLQRTPIPVLGGVTVIFGVSTGVMSFNLFGNFYDMLPVFASILIIMIIGLIDDIISLSSRLRLIIEVLLVLYLIYATGQQINDFHGLWGVQFIPEYISIPLTVLACVGIINAINLIDGVDGYSSGYSIVSCILFGIMFYSLNNIRMVALAAIVVASLIPFFLHNVFGKQSKMFIGDAGTLSLGLIFSVFVVKILSSPLNTPPSNPNLGLIPFSLAVLCIPVFDTLRVMSTRILKGYSPFLPDKTHLHHLFIELGFSHIGTTSSIIGLNLLIVLCWYLAYKVGLSIDNQLYVVIVLGFCTTFVFYPFTKLQIRKKSAIYHILVKVAERTHIQRKGLWLLLRKWADRTTCDEMQNIKTPSEK